MKRNTGNKILKIILNSKFTILGLVIGIILVMTVQLGFVSGTSMQPTLDNGNMYLINKINHDPKRFDIIIFDHDGQTLVKRVIGMPGDEIQITNGATFINGKQITLEFPHLLIKFSTINNKLGKDEYYVLGDNQVTSVDSRIFGPIKKNTIKGTLLFKIW